MVITRSLCVTAARQSRYQGAMEAIPAMRKLFQMDRQNYNPEGKVYKRPSARAVILKDGNM